MKEHLVHPLAEIFPQLPADEMTALVADIKSNGLRWPITLFDDKILDGRHRYEACLIANVPPRFDYYSGNDPSSFVISANLRRRHLTTSQRAIVAAKLANAPQGRPEIKPANLPVYQSKAAETLAVSERSVRSAAKIIDRSPKLANAVASGSTSLHAAEQKLKKEQAAEVEQMDKTGWPIPQKIQASWDTATEEARAGMHSLSKMKTRFEEAGEKQIVHFREVIITGAVVACKSLYSDWKNVLPFAVCPVCSGKVAHTCSMCKGRGYVSEFFWSRCVTKEMKDLRAKISAKQGK